MVLIGRGAQSESISRINSKKDNESENLHVMWVRSLEIIQLRRRHLTGSEFIASNSGLMEIVKSATM